MSVMATTGLGRWVGIEAHWQSGGYAHGKRAWRERLVVGGSPLQPD